MFAPREAEDRRVSPSVARAEAHALVAADVAVDDAAIDAVLSPHVRQRYALDDPAWRELESKSIGTRRLGVRRWVRRVLSMGRNARAQGEVRSGYESHWQLAPSVSAYVSSLDDRALAVRWRDRGMLLAPQAIRLVHLLYFLRVIDALRPRRVLEIGCGNGNIILTLATLYPEIEFAGLELTEAGIAAARQMQTLETLPAVMTANLPRAMHDPAAHRRVELKVGDARALPYAPRAFDLVLTRLALEQMEQIRHQALAETTRVADRAVALIEPWREFNRVDPGRAYVRRMGYFKGRTSALERLGFRLVLVTDDIPQKVQFSAGPAIAVRR